MSKAVCGVLFNARICAVFFIRALLVCAFFFSLYGPRLVVGIGGIV